MALSTRWAATLDRLKQQERFRSFRLPSGLDFTSNDYLGYSSSRHFFQKPDHLTVSGTSSRLLRGHQAIWDEVEQQLASWHQVEATLMMTSGYAANEGLLSTIIEPRDSVFTDRLNHACIADGLRLARPKQICRFRHNDLNDLEAGLKQAQWQAGERFIVTESLFSMDGDQAPLAAMAELAEKYGAHLIVDEAHTTGCFGPTGAGLVDALGLRSRVLATVHTGGKALGVTGAYIAGSKLLKEWLVNRCRHLLFTTALPPVVGAWWQQSIEHTQQDHSGRESLRNNANAFRHSLRSRDIECAGSDYIIPIVLGADARAVDLAHRVQAQGFDVRAVRPPTVPEGTARLRISIHANHTPEQLEKLAHVIAEAWCR